MQYNFDWDPAKERINLQKHKVDFRRAATVFRDPNQLSVYDEDHSEEEERWATIGIDREMFCRWLFILSSRLQSSNAKSGSFLHAKQNRLKLEHIRVEAHEARI